MEEFEIRECETVDELDLCVKLQREVFGLPDLEISPRRHLIVSRQAGGWTLGAFATNDSRQLAGFVHHLVALRGQDEVIGYSHMMAVRKEYQNRGLGARLKWAQRARALAEGRRFIRWTFEPMQARNAYFNLNRLGVVVRTYGDNFYGTDYVTDPAQASVIGQGIGSDRMIANWELESPRVVALASGVPAAAPPDPVGSIEIPANWNELIKNDIETAKREHSRVRSEFMEAFSKGLICAGFEREPGPPRYLLYAAS